MRYLALYILIFFCSIANCYAAIPLPADAQQTTVNAAHNTLAVETKKIECSFEPATENELKNNPRKLTSPRTAYWAFGLGLLAFASIVTGLTTSTPVLLGIGVAIGIVAVVLGFRSLKKRKRGFGIAGMAIGFWSVFMISMLALMSVMYYK